MLRYITADELNGLEVFLNEKLSQGGWELQDVVRTLDGDHDFYYCQTIISSQGKAPCIVSMPDSHDLEDLEKFVNMKLAVGWEPYGRIMQFSGPDHMFFCQMLIREVGSES